MYLPVYGYLRVCLEEWREERKKIGQGDRSVRTSVGEVTLPAARQFEFLPLSLSFTSLTGKKQSGSSKNCSHPLSFPWSRRGRPGRELVV